MFWNPGKLILFIVVLISSGIFIWYITSVTFPISFPKVNFRIEHLKIRKVILIKLTKLFESDLSITISFFSGFFCSIGVLHLVWSTGHQKFSNFFLKILHLNHSQDVQLQESWMTFCNIHLECLMADLLCLFALNKVFVFSLIYLLAAINMASLYHFLWSSSIWCRMLEQIFINALIKFIACNISIVSLFNKIFAGNVITMMR